MQKLYHEGNISSKPNVHTFNTVINACAWTKCEADKKEAFRIAFSSFKQMISLEGIKPTEVTYICLLNTIHYLVPLKDKVRRFSLVKAVFEMCCKDGLATDKILSKLKSIVTEKQFDQLVRAQKVLNRSP